MPTVIASVDNFAFQSDPNAVSLAVSVRVQGGAGMPGRFVPIAFGATDAEVIAAVRAAAIKIAADYGVTIDPAAPIQIFGFPTTTTGP